jgi:4-hydroxy-4-methyl-2-oxoglutarate aldolase
MKTELTTVPLGQLRSLSTCVVASAVEAFRVRLPNTGFADSTIRCMFDGHPPVAGYAATARIRSANPPMEGHGYTYGRADFWNHILSTPAPRIVVLEDVDGPPGLGAFVGEVNASILLALGCECLVTNGAVRDLAEVRTTGLQMFAGNVSVSHAYAHILDVGGPVKVGGLAVQPGDLLHGDGNGIQTIPLEIAALVPAMAFKILLRRKRLVELCQGANFSLDAVRGAIQEPELHI